MASSWTSLQIATLAVEALTPVTVAAFTSRPRSDWAKPEKSGLTPLASVTDAPLALNLTTERPVA